MHGNVLWRCIGLPAAHGLLLREPGLAAVMAAESRRLAPSLLWPAVATEYVDLARSLTALGARSVA